jgi:hypothetical protein
LQTRENRAAHIAYGAYGSARHIALPPRASELEVAAEKRKKGEKGARTYAFAPKRSLMRLTKGPVPGKFSRLSK